MPPISSKKPLNYWWKVEDRGFTSPCWIWQGYQNPNGYCYYTVWHGKSVKACRYVYERYKGKIPKDLDLDHLCRQRMCVNPNHLEPVTHAENCRRAREYKKWMKTF